MWPSNSKNINNLNTRPLQIDQIKNNIIEQGPIYQTPIKQSINVQGNNETPLQFDFNFFFGSWSSGHMPVQNNEIPINNSVTQLNRDANLLLFKSSLEKSGYKLTPASEIKNTNIIEYGITNNLDNIYENELNQNEFTKKNLTELFNNAKNDEFLQSNKKGNTITNNLLENNNNIYYYNTMNNNNNPNNIIISNKNIVNPNLNYNIINNKNNNNKINNNKINNNNIDYEEEEDNKENKNINNINNIYLPQNILNRNYEKNMINNNNNNNNNNYNINNSNINEKNDKIIFNDKGEEIFNSPINKKPRKIFECSGSTLATNSSKSSTRKRRFRKNNEQLIMLSQFFNEHKHWSKNQIKEISQRTGLKENKVYKWLWDQRNKEYKATKFIINKKNIP